MADEPVTMVEAPTSAQARRRQEQATVTDGRGGTVPRRGLELDADEIDRAREDAEYVNELMGY